MLSIGLTGGIASGKSTVQKEFEALGAPVIDADKISHGLTASGQAAVKDIAALRPGVELVRDGQLQRKVLRDLMFKDSVLRQQVEAILHPLIIDGIRQRLESVDGSYAIVAIPLLTEIGGASSLVNRIAVVDCPEALQIARLIERDGESEHSALRILAAQAGREQRLEYADDVINNSGSLEALRECVHELHRRYQSLSLAGVSR